VQLDPLLIVFSVPLSQRNEVEKDQVVELRLGADQVKAEGIVEYVSPTSDTSNSSVRVKVRLPNSNHQYQSGERAILAMIHPANNANPAATPAPEMTSPAQSVQTTDSAPAIDSVNTTLEESSGTPSKSTPVAARN
jgi:hypothetical protein